jgi:predicted small lipoprotein YifL
MKRIIALLLMVLLAAALTACGTTPPDPTKPADQAQNTQPQQTEPAEEEGVFSFTFEGIELIPGAPFDPSALPEADSIFEVPSCAIEGTDNVYSYSTMELTAYDDGTGEVIYSIYLLDADTPTTEGLYVGDDLARVEELYGADYETNDTELTFTKGNTTLNLLMDGETVISIEYRMAV